MNNIDERMKQFAESQERYRTTGKCMCGLSEKMVGDGCYLCNPSLALYHSKYALLEAEAENERMRKALLEIAYGDAYEIITDTAEGISIKALEEIGDEVYD